MFATIARFELRYQMRNPVFWVAIVLFCLMTFMSVTVDTVRIAGGGNVHINGPVAVAVVQSTMSIFFMFVTAAFVANAVVRDDESGFAGIVRATKVDKIAYMSGRFAGAFAGAALAFLAVPLAIWAGTLMPWIDSHLLGPNRIQDHLFAYGVIALPNLLITSAILFSVACWTRSVTYSYLAVILLMTGYYALTGMVKEWPDFALAAYLEPFGSQALDMGVRYLTPTESNEQALRITPLLAGNRLIWLAIAAALVTLSVWRFRFAESGASGRAQRRERATERARPAERPLLVERLPAADPARAAWWQLRTRTLFEMKLVFKSPAFWVLVVVGGLFLVNSLMLMQLYYGVPIWPRTFAIIETVQNSSSVIGLLIAIYFSGEIVWRERERRFSDIVDATPLPSWILTISKTAAVAGVLLVLTGFTVIEAVLFQLSRGLTDIDPGEWLFWFGLPGSIYLILIGILSVFVQVISPNKFVGWAIMLLYVILIMVGTTTGWDYPLYTYAGWLTPLSDMNGADYGGAIGWWVRLYWAGFAAMLIVIGHLIWRRGTAVTLKSMWRRLPGRLRGTPLAIFTAALIVTVTTGGWLFYNMNILNQYVTREDRNRQIALYERKYGSYAGLPQPIVTDVKLDVRIFPADEALEADGSYRYVNATGKPIEQLHVRQFPGSFPLASLTVPGARRIHADPELGYWIYRFDRPLQPNESRSLSFRNQIRRAGLKAVMSESSLKEHDTRILKNGTFINNVQFAPVIGMSRWGLLRGKALRRKHGLPAEAPPARLADRAAQAFNYVGFDRVRSDITVSTSADQIPIAAGEKLSDTVSDGRRTARFVLRKPSTNFFSIQSARYQVKTADADGIPLEIYYDRRHGMNVDRMLGAMQDSLAYFRANFGPYQYPYARIVEVPGYWWNAQAFPGTIPYSEGLGFTMDLRDPTRIDVASYVTSHELAHQYWFHQLMPARMEGATVLVESLAQYSALMVMKRRYGAEQIGRFLKYETDDYFQGRRKETVEESPLIRTYGQDYIHYHKASVVMYLLQDRLGEQRINGVLRGLLEKYRFKGAPYPRSIDLVQGLLSLARAPAERELILDQFARITVYDLKAPRARVRRLPNGLFETVVTIAAGKTYSDGKGNERPAAFDEAVDIGLFAARPGEGRFTAADVVSTRRLQVRSGEQTVRLVSRRKPAFAAIDPYMSFLDRNWGDNVVTVSEAGN